ncbi:MAG: glycosyl transferase family 2, partial [Clostridiales bacterium]|nr:glycosyl transferase family 2 [Clostridiales bacterium]
MKVCVYTIAKNEAKFVGRWVDSAKEADVLCVTDTGSADGAADLLRGMGVTVTEADITPFRFDTARNISLEAIPPDIDVCVCADMDEVLTPGWRLALERAWSGGVTRMSYRYIWSFNPDGSPGVSFWADKIHAREGYKWAGPVHETLKPSIRENISVCYGFEIRHKPDSRKSRSAYLPLLELAIAEEPENDRNTHYLGREYMYYGRDIDAVNTLKRHLLLKSAIWRDERSASMRYIARCCLRMGDEAAARLWLLRAMAEAPYLREPYVEMAFIEDRRKDSCAVLELAEKAVSLEPRPGTYLVEGFAYDGTIYDLAALACFRLGRKREALA